MYYCGWDGGGSSTKVFLLPEEGAACQTQGFGPLNPNGSTPGAVRQTVADCVQWMANQAGGLKGCGGLVIGIAGVSNLYVAQLLENAVRECGYHGNLRLLGDQEIALAGAIDGPGAILIAGTGSICFGRDKAGHTFRAGGFGYLIDDAGSGYAIGRDILAAVARASDGRNASTCLTPLVFDALGISDIPSMITWLYSAETCKKDVAALSPLLLEALRRDDPTALRIARKAADDLSELVLAAWRKNSMQGGELALCGSILTHYPIIRERLSETLRKELPELSVIPPRRSAAQGAAELAKAFFHSDNPR